MQQQLSWLQQQSKLPELDEAELSLAKIKETGPSTKQTAADTLGIYNICYVETVCIFVVIFKLSLSPPLFYMYYEFCKIMLELKCTAV